MYGGGGWTVGDEILDDNSKAPHDGDDGPDKMWGNSGEDIMFGNLGDDEINGNLGNDYIEGNEGQDTIHGSPGADIIRGGHNIPNQDDSGDTLFGDEGVDYIEGNAGQDTIHGGLGDDLIIGGSNKAEEIDKGDFLYGDEGSDTILGDNGAFDGDDEALIKFMLNPQILIYENVVMLDDYEENDDDSYAGPDKIYGGPGDDLIFGQWEGKPEPGIESTVDDQMDRRDNLYGEQGQDLIIGDQGTVVCEVSEGNQEELRTKAPFLIDEINLDNTLHCTVTLEYDGEDPKPQDGDDLISGGENTDWLFGGGGMDLINGDEGNDRIFGGFGDDFLWGGPDHDHLWGGSGKDHLDVLPREAAEKKVKGKLEPIDADPEIVFEWADADDYTGRDYMYGGLGQDAMQADVAPKGPNLGDRMIDWIGVYNIYYLCPAQYGEGVITRSPSPQVIDFLIELATSDGADTPRDKGTSGYLEIALVYQQYFKYNSHPPHPDTPGHFTCEP
jgi:Ca2+-binding RTX toxin-like protein